MGWFRGRRKRREAGPAAGSRAGSSDRAAGQAPASGAAVPDRVRWRHLEHGAWERLVAPLQYDATVSALLDYCAGSEPWDADAVHRLIGLTTHARPVLNRLLGREQPAGAQSAEFIDGLIKAAALLPAEDAVPLLVRLALQQCALTATSMPTARAAIRALATVPGELVPPALHQLTAEARLAVLRRAAYAELKRKLTTLSDAPEWTAGTFGLDASSRVRVPLGPGHVAVLRVETGGRVGVRYFERGGPEAAEGRPLSGRPAGATVSQDALRQVSDLASELRTAVNAARTRLESAQKERREVPVEDWLEHYITHPVTGRLSRTLLWEVRAGSGEEWRTGLPRQVEGRWGLITADTERIVPGDGDVLRVLPLVRLPDAQARAWLRLLAKAKVKPVLKQIKAP